MAVFQLAQFDIRIPETESVANMSAYLWHPGVGIIASGGAEGLSDIGVGTLDGIFRDRSQLGSFRGYPGWWPSKKRMVEVWNMGGIGGDPKPIEMMFDPYVFARQATKPPGVETPGLMSTRYIKLDDRSVYFSAGPGGDHHIHGVVDGVDTIEGPVLGSPDGFGMYYGTAYPGRSETELFVSGASPGQKAQAVFYDTVTRNVSSPYMFIDMPANFLGFATDWGVMFSLHPASQFATMYNQICIWSLEVRPTVLSPVEVLRGEPRSGQVVTYRVRALGANADPAEDETINWTITRDIGTLLDFQSKTDKDGYATTRVQYQVGESGLSYVEASLAC